MTGKVDVRHIKPEAVKPSPDDLKQPEETEEFFEDESQNADDLDPAEEVAHADD